jgi:hypothetical protein
VVYTVENRGRVAQLGEHLLCKQGVAGSIPVTSTNFSLITKDLLNLSFSNLPSFVHTVHELRTNRVIGS